MLRFAPLFFILLLCPAPVFAQSPEDRDQAKTRSQVDKAKLKVLFKQLGDDSYETREAASMKLLAMGRSIIPALKELYAESRDPEVRGRSFNIAEKIQRDYLRKKGKGYLGVRINTSGPQGGDLKGVEVSSVDENLPASKAGIRKGDRIVEVNKIKIDNFDQLKEAITSFAAGDKVTVVVLRNQKRLKFFPILTKFPEPPSTTTPRPIKPGNIVRPPIRKIQPNVKRQKLQAQQNNEMVIKRLTAELKRQQAKKNPDKNQIAQLEQIIELLKKQRAAAAPKKKKK